MSSYDNWKLSNADDERATREPFTCPHYGEPCPHDGEDCEEQCVRELSQCEACGLLKFDCVSTSFHGLDVYACAACRGAEEDRDETADRDDWAYHNRRGE